jgi:putative endonuclease
MYYVYVLQSVVDGLFYTGSTPDLERRFKEHCDGKVQSTKSRRPLRLIYYEASFSREDAIRRERYLKTGMGKRYLRNRLAAQQRTLTG